MSCVTPRNSLRYTPACGYLPLRKSGPTLCERLEEARHAGGEHPKHQVRFGFKLRIQASLGTTPISGRGNNERRHDGNRYDHKNIAITVHIMIVVVPKLFQWPMTWLALLRVCTRNVIRCWSTHTKQYISVDLIVNFGVGSCSVFYVWYVCSRASNDASVTFFIMCLRGQIWATSEKVAVDSNFLPHAPATNAQERTSQTLNNNGKTAPTGIRHWGETGKVPSSPEVPLRVFVTPLSHHRCFFQMDYRMGVNTISLLILPSPLLLPPSPRTRIESSIPNNLSLFVIKIFPGNVILIYYNRMYRL